MTESVRESRSHEWLRDNAPDCGDNSCLFGGRGKGGVRTNGGCRCFKDLPTAKRIYVERLYEAFTQSETEHRPGSASYVTAQRIHELEAKAEQDGDWQTAFERMCQRANTLAKIVDERDKEIASTRSHEGRTEVEAQLLAAIERLEAMQSASVAIDPEVARGALPVMEDLLAGIFPEDMGWVSRLVDELRRSDSCSDIGGEG